MSTPTDIITRCPQCAIAFKATAQVLKIADGNVRCGSCLSVFNAASHAVDRPATLENSVQQDDESWALDLIADEEENDFDIDLDADDEKEAPESDALLLDIINNDLLDNRTAPSVHDDIHIDLEAELGLEFETDSHTELDPHLDLSHLDDTTDYLDSITLQNDDMRTPKRWPWMIGTLCLTVVLIAQIAWLRFDTLSQRDPYRHYYSKICEQLHCTLPIRLDLTQIRTSHLVIRSHPDDSNALIADAIIVNNADFEQSFPALQLEFRNINNELIARRDFQPREYLKGELINATIMPSKQAVQLALAIVDPGENAINYRINITAPRP